MSDEPNKPKAPTWVAYWIAVGALLGFVVLLRAFDSPKAGAPRNSAYATGPDAPRDGGEALRIHFGADKATTIAIDEVKKREGWSGNPNWVNVEADEALTWDVTVRRAPRSS